MAHRRRLPLALAALSLAGLSFAGSATSHEVAASSGAGAHSCLGKRATIVSSAARIVATKAADSIVVTGGGKHTIEGLGGNDRIYAQPNWSAESRINKPNVVRLIPVVSGLTGARVAHLWRTSIWVSVDS